MEEVYNSYSLWIRQQFPYRVQKISVDAGFTCPNRDGRVGTHGCIFCDNDTFNPAYCDRNKSITIQLEEGKRFFSRKYPDMKYLAYFQAYSNTYDSLEQLKRRYEEALAVEDVVGLVAQTMRFVAGYEGEIPGASPVECGNYTFMDLDGARRAAATYLHEVLERITPANTNYPE